MSEKHVSSHESPLAKVLIESFLNKLHLADEEFRKKFSVHVERGVALDAATALDHALGAMLKAYMIRDSDLIAWLFDGNGPLLNFGIRIRIAYALGIMSKVIYDELKSIEKIRNQFAHYPEAKTFKHSKIQGHCSSLKLVNSIIKEHMEEPKTASMMEEFKEFDLAQPRYTFLATCILLTAYFRQVAKSAKPLVHPGL